MLLNLLIVMMVTVEVFASRPCHGLGLGLSKFHTLQSARVHGPWQAIDLDWNL